MNVLVTLGAAAALVMVIFVYLALFNRSKPLPERPPTCGVCGRPLDKDEDPMSVDCAGDCWGCVGEVELGGDLDENIKEEIAAGMRNPDGSVAAKFMVRK